MQPPRHRKELRLLLGPTPWPLGELGELGESRHGLEFRLLTKATTRETANDPRRVYYDAGTIASVSGYLPDDRFNRLVDDCVTDPMCHYLAERDRKDVFEGTLAASNKIAIFALYALFLCDEHRIDVVVFHNYPHDLFNYILLKSTIYTDVSPFIIHFSVLPWRMRVSRVSRDLVLRSIRNPEACSVALTAHILQYFEGLRGTHDEAMPAVDKALRRTAGKRFLNLRSEVSGLVSRNPIKHAARIYLKSRSFRALQDATVPKPEGPYVAFFLHYQPEESTLPRGGFFAQQMLAISKLRSLLPSNLNVLVKEHPSMYRYDYTLSISVRSREFYDSIRRLRGVYIVPQQSDTFELIDNALAISTITGTVAIEALARGTPVICFGEAYYKHFSGVTWYRTMDGPAAPPKLGPHDPLETQADLLREASYSFGGIPSDGSSDVETLREAALVAYEHVFAHLRELIDLNSDADG